MADETFNSHPSHPQFRSPPRVVAPDGEPSAADLSATMVHGTKCCAVLSGALALIQSAYASQEAVDSQSDDPDEMEEASSRVQEIPCDDVDEKVPATAPLPVPEATVEMPETAPICDLITDNSELFIFLNSFQLAFCAQTKCNEMRNLKG